MEREADRNPSRTATCLGLADVLEAVAVPSPWLPTAEDAVRQVVDKRYQGHGVLAREDNWGLESGGPFKEATLERILEHPKAHIPDWVVDAAADTIAYIAEKYGCAPAYISPVRAKFSLQVHHLDQDYYRQFHVGDDHPFVLTEQIRSHFSRWHGSDPDPSAKEGE